MGAKQDAETQRAEAQLRKTAAINSMAKSAGSALTGISGILDKNKPTVEEPYDFRRNSGAYGRHNVQSF